MSVNQWRNQFLHWSTLSDKHVVQFTASNKDPIRVKKGEALVVITTYNMVAFNGQRSAAADAMMKLITSQEWGLILLDEVHVAPARMFRRCMSLTHSRCFDPSTLVLMSDYTSKRIVDIAVNEMVWGDDNTLRRVINTIPVQQGTMYQVKQDKAVTYYVNYGHLLVLRAFGVNAYVLSKRGRSGQLLYYVCVYIKCNTSGLCSHNNPCGSFKVVAIRCDSEYSANEYKQRYNTSDSKLVLSYGTALLNHTHFVHDNDEFIIPVQNFNTICTNAGRQYLKGFTVPVPVPVPNATQHKQWLFRMTGKRMVDIPTLSPRKRVHDTSAICHNHASSITVSIASDRTRYCGIQVDGNNKFLLHDYTVVHNCKLGLTATLVREDNLIDDLYFLIGPKLYEANWLDLQQRGFLATVQCIEVWCSMTAEFYTAYLDTDSRKQSLLWVMNPNKFRTCEYLIRLHESRGDKILVFADNVYALIHYATVLKRPMIYGATSDAERLQFLYRFQHGSDINTLFISKVGDTSLDLPDVNVIIQISSHYASRRQEAQRLGRILRPKSVSSNSQYNAFFYTLVSQDTREMMYASKRQRFLVDQGYAYKVLNELPEMNTISDLKYTTIEEQRKLLYQCMSASDHDIDQDDIVDENDTFEKLRQTARNKLQNIKQSGNISVLSGGNDRVYHEITTVDKSKKRNILFRKKDEAAKERARQAR